MALARVTTWNPGDTLTAAALNSEFNNLLNNPISLISPTTGAINFQTSVAHTNLTPGAITASSGTAGSLLIASTAGSATAIYSTGINFVTTSRTLQAQRLGMAGQGTVWTSNNLSLGGGWSTGGSFANIRGGDLAASFQILTSGIGAGVPTLTSTYADGLFQTVPITLFQQFFATSFAAPPAPTLTANSSGMTLTFPGFVPTSSGTYLFTILTMG